MDVRRKPPQGGAARVWRVRGSVSRFDEPSSDRSARLPDAPFVHRLRRLLLGRNGQLEQTNLRT
jgi:hypothetical protein